MTDRKPAPGIAACAFRSRDISPYAGGRRARGPCLRVCAMPDQEQKGQEVAPAGRGALRVSHEDRDQVAEALRVAAGDGRLTSDELDERLERALTARTYDDLAVLVADLPPAGHALAPVPGTQLPTAPAKELIKIDVTSGHSQRVGRWT